MNAFFSNNKAKLLTSLFQIIFTCIYVCTTSKSLLLCSTENLIDHQPTFVANKHGENYKAIYLKNNFKINFKHT